MEERIDELLLSKINDKGLQMIHWILCILSKVLYVGIYMGGVSILYSYGINWYYSLSHNFTVDHFLPGFISGLMIPLLVLPIPYLIVRFVEKIISNKDVIQPDEASVFFGAGVLMIVYQLSGVLHVINILVSTLVNLLQPGPTNFMTLSGPLFSIVFTSLYIIIGLKYIRKSGYLKRSSIKKN